MITVQKVGAADNLDVLAGTDLENIPLEGQLDIWIVATGADTVYTVTAPGQETPIRNQTVPQKAAALINTNDDNVVSIPVYQGKYILAIDITAASTWAVCVIFRSLAELGL